MLADVVRVPAHEVGDVAADQAVAHQLARVDHEVLAIAALIRGKVVLLGYLMTVATCIYFGVLIRGAYEAGSLMLAG